MKIKSLFDPSRDIYRTIEKVITYNASQEDRLRAEITEYIVTASIEEQFEKLLDKMQLAMESGGQSEVGVWVSGFYGSGKSSYTKYLGLALDDRVSVDGVPFLKHLQDRLHRPQTRAALTTVARRYPAAVVLLDLASEMVAGATMEEVSTVLYYKVLQWAGYSRNLKVAALERKLKKDGRYDEFTARVQRDLGLDWREVQNDPLVIDSLVPAIAHELYPRLFQTPTAFGTDTSGIIRFENDRVQEMIAIARETTGKEFILFIVDEVGQYVSSRPHLILNLDGLAKNLKALGGGKAWIIGTAQQTLTEDDPKATLNSPELYKLKDRFPIQVELESKDIKEICYKRLLGKSTAGEQALGRLFDAHGQALRHHTKLLDAPAYGAGFDRKTFIDLYPFLPAHFDILLNLLGQLARSTGGIGLRSAIKVIQDVLVEGADEKSPAADNEVGWLATAVTLYDALEKDIRRAFPSIHAGVAKVEEQYKAPGPQRDVAKTVAVLQILDNMPATPHNVACLLHPGVDAPSQREAVDRAIKDLTSNTFVPFGEENGNLRFFSERIREIDAERAQLTVRSIETTRLQNEVLRELFNPQPSTRLHNTLAVTTGLRAANGASVVGLAGERETVQTVIEFVDPRDYEAARARLVDESRQRSAQQTVFLIGRTPAEAAERLAEIARCRDIASRYRNDPEREVKTYCASQSDRADRLTAELGQLLRRSLGQGSFIFRGQVTAVESLDPDVLEAARKHLSEVAPQVFDRYAEAPVRAETGLAERLLRNGNLRSVTAALDPLGLVQSNGGVARIDVDHKALVSIRDYIERNGSADGKRLTDVFTSAPYGWSPDTLRYLVAVMLLAGEVKLKVSGREVTVNGQQAIEALRTNNSFKLVGVALRDGRPSTEVLARAAQRLTDLIGDSVLPLEDDISKAAAKHLPQLQPRYGALAARLDALGVPGAEAVRDLTRDLADLLLTDASDAPKRLGAEESALYERLRWAREVDAALSNGLEDTIRDLQRHRRVIAELPEYRLPVQLQADLAETLTEVGDRLSQDDFHRHAADLRGALTTLQARTRDAAQRMLEAQAERIKLAQAELQQRYDWYALEMEEKAQLLAQLDALAIDAPHDLDGLAQVARHDYMVQEHVRDIERRVEHLARIRVEPQGIMVVDGVGSKRIARMPARVKTAADLARLIGQLQAIHRELAAYEALDLRIEIAPDED